MELLQIGQENWIQYFQAPENIIWHHTTIDDLSLFLENLKKAKLAALSSVDEGEEAPKISILFQGILITSSVREQQLEPLMNMVESSAVFYDSTVELISEKTDGFIRRKLPQKVDVSENRFETLQFLSRICFPSQYGAKLKIPDIDVSPDFNGKVSYTGYVHANFEGDFGQKFTPLFSYRYNLRSFPVALELWQEYVKEGNCAIQIEIVPIYKGSLYDMDEPIILTEKDMEDSYILPSRPEIGSYAISVFAKGKGLLSFGPMHWRYSREGYGNFVLGGKRRSDSSRQEFIYYFNPGDMKPPMNVYFSGFRGAEGFEGFGILKSLKSPFMLIGDPRLEGGAFYLGSTELEEGIQEVIQESLNYLGFESSQMILSGLSMGTFGALYYASRFNPYGIVIGKPFTNVGDTASGMKLKRPYEFETSGDVLLNATGDNDHHAIDSLNKKFWDKFKRSEFPDTHFAIAYMENDDYDSTATQKLIEHLSKTNSHIFTQGYEGRHNDNSRSINRWFMRQYIDLLGHGFGRTY